MLIYFISKIYGTNTQRPLRDITEKWLLLCVKYKCTLNYKFIVMPQVIDNKKEVKNTEVLKSKMLKEKTPFQKEWEKAISIEEVRTHLLKKVRSLWKK